MDKLNLSSPKYALTIHDLDMRITLKWQDANGRRLNHDTSAREIIRALVTASTAYPSDYASTLAVELHDLREIESKCAIT